MPDLPHARAPRAEKETPMNLAYVTETVIGLALISIAVGGFIAGLAYLATRNN